MPVEGTAYARSASTAHVVAMKTDVERIAEYLIEVLGRKVVAVLAGVSDPKTVSRWAGGDQRPRSDSEQRLRLAYQVFQMIQTDDSPHTVRAWFMGLNPQLDDSSPVIAIRDGRFKDVMTAAKSFMQGG